MSLIALALDQDIAVFTTHHVVQIAFIVIIGPAVFLEIRTGSPFTTETRE
ncbi:MAG: hypothetical protein P8L66_08620 [Rhodospirillaceae bacterium]|nr:hypothetical protein [Rhodospirillaceae bacterium]